MKLGVLGMVLAGALVAGPVAQLAAQQDAAVQTEDYTVPEGTEFKLQLHTTINSRTSRKGDRIISTLYDPVYVYDQDVLPRGARVDGHIGDVKAAAHRGKGGYLTIIFDSVELPSGQRVSILGSLTEVFSSESGSESTVGVEGNLRGPGASRKERLAIIAIPTAGAAVGGVGPAIAAGVASTVAAFILPKGKQASLEAGSLIGMRLDRDVTFTLPAKENN
jgi:hypothetical protein